MRTLAARLKEEAIALGFALAGIARAGPADDFARLSEWLDRGYAGEMAYMRRHADARRHPAAVLPEVRSVVMVGTEYGETAACGIAGDALLNRKPQSGKIARYARGPDYHDVLRARLKQLLKW